MKYATVLEWMLLLTCGLAICSLVAADETIATKPGGKGDVIKPGPAAVPPGVRVHQIQSGSFYVPTRRSKLREGAGPANTAKKPEPIVWLSSLNDGYRRAIAFYL